MSKRKGPKAKTDQSKDKVALAEIEQVFRDFDPGETGILERQRAYEAISTLGITGGNEVVAMMDPENNGFVTHDVFVDIALSAMLDESMDETAKQAFQIFDMDHKGRFTFEMLKKVARDVGEEWSDAEMREMFDMADQNEDGMIDRDEFIIIMERIGLS